MNTTTTTKTVSNIVTPEYVASLKAKSLSEIALIISRDWGSKVNYAAKPYLSAMRCLDTVEDCYGYDTGSSIVSYFLANASSWRGDVAKAVRAELRRRLK